MIRKNQSIYYGNPQESTESSYVVVWLVFEY